jgi:uncharacterized SAM-binding protein YcdF (DUF218 family)
VARSAPPYAYAPTRPLPMARRARRSVPLFRVFGFLFLFALAFFVASGITLGLLIERQARRDEARPSDAIVVLGAAQWDGKPSPVLQARLDHAIDLYRAGYAPEVIVTGGVGIGDQYSEGEVARQYLLKAGIPASAILTESRGRDSYESMVGAAALMQRNGWNRVLLVSDGFHLYRVKRMAADLGLDAATSPTQTSPIRPGSAEERRYVLREIASLAHYLLLRR